MSEFFLDGADALQLERDMDLSPQPGARATPRREGLLAGASRAVGDFFADPETGATAPFEGVGRDIARAYGVGRMGLLTAGREAFSRFNAHWEAEHPEEAAAIRRERDAGADIQDARWFDDLLKGEIEDERAIARRTRIDPATRSEAANIIGGLSGLLAQAALTGPVGTGVGVGLDEYDRLIGEGVDPDAASQAAKTYGAGMAAMVVAPVAMPGRIAVRALTGAGLNLGIGAGLRGSMEQTLRDAGYDEQADAYKWLDGRAMAIDAIFGAAFGAAFGPRAIVGRTPPHETAQPGSPEGAPEPSPDGPAPYRPSPDTVAAAIVEAESIHRDFADGVPLDPRSARWRSDTLARAEERAANDEALDPLEDVPEGIGFVDPHMEARAAELEEAFASLADELEAGGYADLAAELRAAKEQGLLGEEDGGLMFSRGDGPANDVGFWRRIVPRRDEASDSRAQIAERFRMPPEEGEIDTDPLWLGNDVPLQVFADTHDLGSGYEGAINAQHIAELRRLSDEINRDAHPRIRINGRELRPRETHQTPVEQAELYLRKFKGDPDTAAQYARQRGFTEAAKTIEGWRDARAIEVFTGPQFSRGGLSSGASPEALKATAIASFGRDAQTLFDMARVEIVGDGSEAAARSGWPSISSGVKAFHWRGKTYVLASNVSPREMASIMLHEVGVHAGMREMLGARGFARVTAKVDALAEAGNPIAALAKERVDDLVKRGLMDPKHAKEEALAYLVESAPDLPFVRRLLAELRQWLYRTFNGAEWLGSLTAEDIRQMAVASLRRQARLARREAREAKMLGQFEEAAMEGMPLFSRKGWEDGAPTDKRFRTRTPGLNRTELPEGAPEPGTPEWDARLAEAQAKDPKERSALDRAMIQWAKEGEGPLFSFGGPRAATFNRPGVQLFRGPNGDLRFEIDDSQAVIKKPPIGTYRLDEIMEHPPLYEAYPDLRSVRVVIDPRMSYREGGEAGAREIRISPLGIADMAGAGLSNLTFRDTLIHEVQHLIQHEEGIKGGGGPDWIAKNVDLNGLASSSREAYERLHWEMEAHAATERADMSPQARAAVPPYDPARIGTMRTAPEGEPLAIISRPRRLADIFKDLKPYVLVRADQAPYGFGDGRMQEPMFSMGGDDDPPLTRYDDPVGSPDFQKRLKDVRSRIGEAEGASGDAGRSGEKGRVAEDNPAGRGSPGRDGAKPARGAGALRQGLGALSDLLDVAGIHLTTKKGDEDGLVMGRYRLTVDPPFKTNPELDEAVLSKKLSPKEGGPTWIDFDVVEAPGPKEDRSRGVYLKHRRVADALKGKGLGVWMTQRLYEWALERGYPLYSDFSISVDAQRLDAALRRRGYVYEQIRSYRIDEHGAMVNEDYLPIFRIRSGPDVEPIMDGAPAPRGGYEIDGPTLAERLAKEEERLQSFARDPRPEVQAVIDEPDLKVPDEAGETKPASEALSEAEAAEKEAREMKPGYDAAASCAAQHGFKKERPNGDA